MKVGVLSDVHANLPALQAVLAVLGEAEVDAVLVAGDVVGYGPHPLECIDRLVEIGAVAVAGNHELYLRGELPDDRFSEDARLSLQWTMEALDSTHFRWITDLPRQRAWSDFLVTHGSIDDPQEYVVRPRQAAQQLGRMAQGHPGLRFLVLGHSHQPFVYSDGRLRPQMRSGRATVGRGGCLLNPGSVGQSRQWERRPLARGLIVDLDDSMGRWFAVPYSHELVEADCVAAGLPSGSTHIRPGVARAMRRSLRMRFDHRPSRKAGGSRG